MIFSRIFGATAGIILTVAQLSAQGRGSPTGSTSPTGSPGNIGGTTSPTGKSNSPGNFPGDAPRAMLINGKVTIDDGSTPGEPVKIERVCNGRARPEAYTDGKGRFQFTLGQEQDMMADASETAGRMSNPSNPNAGVRESQLVGCDLRAVLPGFRSDLLSLANHRYLDNPDVGTIVLHRMANVEGLTTSATSAMAPKDARKAFEKGLEAEKKSKPDDAQKDFEKAVEVYPKYASAWFELGKIYEQHDHLDQARNAYNQSLTADSKYINPYERLYLM